MTPTQSQEFYPRLDSFFRQIPQGGLRFGDMVNQPSRVTEAGVDPIIRGMMATPAKLPSRLTPAVTEAMFGV